MSLIVFVICAIIVIKRVRRGTTFIVPAILGVLALLSAAHTVLLFMRIFSAVEVVNPADKATILAASTSELMTSSTVLWLLLLPVVIASYLVDRWLRKRASVRPRGRPEAAPSGSFCSTHADSPAVLVCSRCGGFACQSCSAAKGLLCTTCEGRELASARGA